MIQHTTAGLTIQGLQQQDMSCIVEGEMCTRYSGCSGIDRTASEGRTGMMLKYADRLCTDAS